MPASLTINGSTGDVVVNDLVITKKAIPGSLPAQFVIDDEIEVKVLGEKVACRFAHAIVDDLGRKVRIDLRFERERLVSVFCRLPGATEAMHVKWLEEKLGPGRGRPTRYRWGVAGVGADKSGDVFIFLHNENNTWAP